MDSFELNKIIGAVLFCLLIIMGVNQFGNILIHEKPIKEAGFKVEVAEEAGAAGAAPKKEEQDPPVATLLAAADPADGETVAAKCHACHTRPEERREGKEGGSQGRSRWWPDV